MTTRGDVVGGGCRSGDRKKGDCRKGACRRALVGGAAEGNLKNCLHARRLQVGGEVIEETAANPRRACQRGGRTRGTHTEEPP